MAVFSITVGAALAADIVAVARSVYPAETAGKTDIAAVKVYVAKKLAPDLRAYRLAKVDSTAYASKADALAAAQADAQAALVTLYAAQKTAADSAETDLTTGVS